MSWLRRKTPETDAVDEQTERLARARVRRKAAFDKLIEKLEDFEDKPGTPPYLERRFTYKNGSGD